jgi:DNA-binding response OmpR family regulator
MADTEPQIMSELSAAVQVRANSQKTKDRRAGEIMNPTDLGKAFSYGEAVLPASSGIPLICVGERGTDTGTPALERLEREGFDIRMLTNRTDLIQWVQRLDPSLIAIKTPSSQGSALEFCSGIRWVNVIARTPLIFLAANPSEEERVLALEAGVDDYIAESCSGSELVVRVRAAIRRFGRPMPRTWKAGIWSPFLHVPIGTPRPPIRAGEIEVNPISMTILVRGAEVPVTFLEFRLMYYLVQNRGRVFTREQLLRAVWGDQHVELRSVDACVRRLRFKIERDPSNPTCLKSFRGVGYNLQSIS